MRNSYLIKSLSEIGNAGRLAYIMPLEFLNTGYGKPVKSRLIDGGHLAAIISLDCERDVFPDVALTDVDVKDALQWFKPDRRGYGARQRIFCEIGAGRWGRFTV